MRSCYFNKQGFISSLIISIMLVVYLILKTYALKDNNEDAGKKVHNIEDVRFYSPYVFKVKA